jgi:hypothetical protein
VKGYGKNSETRNLTPISYTFLVSIASKKVYLRALPDPVLPARYSVGTLRRAAQMQRFLKELQLASGVSGGLELLILNQSDWHNLSSYPYGLPLSKLHKDLETDLYSATLFVAADYPNRLLHRFDDPLLQAAKGGFKAPGDPKELLDLLSGCEWAHAVLLAHEEPSEHKWQDEIRAVSSFVKALKKTGQDFLLERLQIWANVQQAAGEESPLSNFTYPRCKMPFTIMLYLQGRVWLQTLEDSNLKSI